MAIHHQRRSFLSRRPRLAAIVVGLVGVVALLVVIGGFMMYWSLASAQQPPAVTTDVVPPVPQEPEASAHSGESAKDPVAVPKVSRKPAKPNHDEDDSGGGGGAWPDWPSDIDKRAFMWVYVYCAGNPRGGPVDEGTSLGDLLALAVKLDFSVMVCLPSSPVPPPPPHHPRLHWLPKEAQELVDSDVEARPRTLELGEAIAASPLGILRQIETINRHLEYRKLMLLSPYTQLGETSDEALRTIERMWAAFGDRYREDDLTAVTAAVVTERGPGTEPYPTDPNSRVVVTVPPGVEDPLRLLHKPARVVISHGLNVAEGPCGLITLYPRLSGCTEEIRSITNVPVQVDLPSGLIVMLSRAALDANLAFAIGNWQASVNGSLYAGITRKKWADLLVTAKLTSLMRMELALASLELPHVLASNARVTLIEKSKGDPDTTATKYRSELLSIAQAGPHIPPDVQSPKLYNAFDDMMPRIVSMSPALRKRRAARADQSLLNKATLYWDPYCSCTGINIEAINFLTALEEKVQVRAVANPDCWCHGFSDADDSSLRRMMKPKLGTGDEHLGMTKSYLEREMQHSTNRRPSVWVTHKPVDAFPTFPYHGAIHFNARPTYHIGRTMIEVDRISHDWVQRLNGNDQVDEIWVPSQFLVDAFYLSGVKKSKKIFVVPEAIDVDVYDPEVVAPVQWIVGRDAPCPSCFKFFSNFKWEPRKGWDVLLHAYFTTFTSDNNVALYLKTYLYMAQNARDVGAIKQRIETYAKDILRLDLAKLPKYYILADESDASEMPSLYRSMDCFVLPTRGEGWGLPFQEAMAMALPTIGTRWGGNVDFMTDENSYLVDVDGLVPPSANVGAYAPGASHADLKGMIPITDTSKRGPDQPMCAEPSAKHLAQLMRHVFHNQEEAKQRGQRARATIVQSFSRSAVAEKVLERLREITGNNADG